MTIEGLGKKFQEARQARSLSLDDAARLTKIRPSRLAEIEADDFSQFPSLAYAKGFLQIYGKFLDVDVSPYLDAFEGSSQVTVDGYSYLQDQPAPKPQRVRSRPREPVAHRPRDRSSPVPFLIAVGAIIIGFVLMKLILDIQRIGPREQMVGVPQAAESATPSATIAPPRPTTPPKVAIAETPVKKVAPAPTATPSIALAVNTPPPAATVAASIPIPDAFVPAFAKTNAAAKATVAPSAIARATAAPTAFAKASAAATAAATVAPKEVRRAEPVGPEDLAKAGVTGSPAAASGPNHVAIKPLKKTYIKVVVDNELAKPAYERWISPSDGTVEFSGQHIAVRVLDRDAIQIKKNGKSIADGDTDVTVE